MFWNLVLVFIIYDWCFKILLVEYLVGGKNCDLFWCLMYGYREGNIVRFFFFLEIVLKIYEKGIYMLEIIKGFKKMK